MQRTRWDGTIADMVLDLEPGAARRRLGNFRTPELAARVREVLSDAGVATSADPDPGRPEPIGRLLDWLVHLTGAKGHRVWVAAGQRRQAAAELARVRRLEQGSR